MLNRVIPMLPRELSNGICSLNEGQDRYTLSVSMEIDNKGKIISSEVYKGIINVTRRMSYKDVQAILDNSNEEIVTKYKDYIADFKLMEELAKILKEKRITKGYLNLDIPESKIILNQDGYAIDVCKYETTFANEIIEQFMLAANETIAEKFYWLKAPFIYRVHEEPDIEKVNELNKLLLFHVALSQFKFLSTTATLLFNSGLFTSSCASLLIMSFVMLLLALDTPASNAFNSYVKII